MKYNFSEIEKKWQKFWVENKTYQVEINISKPKFYVLDMFPYPSGAGLHVGHPLGYIASDIYSRYKRQKGFNVLHPMGYDAFGLPAEQYAIQTGQHPAESTKINIKRYREQMDKIGFSYDWNREVSTCNPDYYKWTQWAFIQMFHNWFNNKTQKAEPIETLVSEFIKHGNLNVDAATSSAELFTAMQWNTMTEREQQALLLNYRLAYIADTMVNWCPELGTVLANDEVKEGLSVRGGFPVEQKKMKQWLLRVSAYAERLLNGLDLVEWSDSLKEMQRNWIGRSQGAQVFFSLQDSEKEIEIFTTRPDTIYGATFMVLAPENELVSELTTADCKEAVENYIAKTKKRTERERLTDVKTVSGEFTGSYAINPFTNQLIPIWISDYVLIGYGTGAIMAVPAHDSRDYAFAKHFDIPIVQVVSGGDITNESYDAKEGKMMNSGIINGLEVKEAIEKIVTEIEKRNLGKRQVNYRIRDAIFSRQRYWGEPFPVFYKNNIPYTLNTKDLPLELPVIDRIAPTETGEPPLGRVKTWKTKDGYPYELSTMPGFAGSSAYYLRFMDPHNKSALVSKEANEYWQDVDLYIGGTEHATGHLIYSRFWNKFLFDKGYVCKEEPFKRLVNQGMIQGRSNFVYRVNNRKYAETALWDELKDGKTGFKFIRDYKVEDQIFAFCCEEKNLIIENSNGKSAAAFLKNNSDLLKRKRMKLLVLTTEEIIENLPKVVAKIKDALKGEKEIEHHFDGVEFPFTQLFVSHNLVKEEFKPMSIHVDVNIVHNDVLDTEAFKKWRLEFENAQFILEDGKYICGYGVEKMSKSLYNVVNPDKIVEQYGADTLRLYEMFLGPLEQSKPWDTQGIEGVHRFLRKLWNLFFDEQNNVNLSEEEATLEEMKILHKTIKKVQEDIERLSFNTSVSAFMICVNELTTLKCNKRAILEPLTILISSFAPHIAEELWFTLGKTNSVCDATFPVLDEKYLVEDSANYAVMFNGKKRFELVLNATFDQKKVEEEVFASAETKKWLEGKTISKVIFVPKKLVNMVVK